jgi:putative N6-adenine-specific DNA methylase
VTNAAPFFAATAPGLEPLVAEELRALGIAGTAEPGGAAFGGGDDALYRANLHLRTASRVLVRLAEFHARSFFELERHARRVPWERVVARGGAVRFRVTCRKSRLYHSDAVAERLMLAAERVGAVEAAAVARAAGADADDVGEGADAQLFVVRVLHDRCTVSADSSGALLHRRGYRQAVARAPLRETLAAGVLLAAGWDPATPLADPLCGSGTIPIEGALLARRIPPGLTRAREGGFAFARWPELDAARWAEVVAEGERAILPRAPAPIVGSDRDAGAVDAAVANAERAGVAADVAIRQAPLSAAPLPPGGGLIAANPPYGVRASEGRDLRGLYARLGALSREAEGGPRRLALLSPDPRLDGQVGMPVREVLRTTNGGIGVRLVVGGG